MEYFLKRLYNQNSVVYRFLNKCFYIFGEEKMRKNSLIAKGLSVMLVLSFILPNIIAAAENGNTPSQSVAIDISSYETTDMAVREEKGYMGRTENVIVTGDTGEISWKFNVASPDSYNLKFDYFPITSKNSSIVLGIKLDGEYIEKTLEEVTFKKLWKNEYDEKKYDSNNNEVLPKQVQTSSVLTAYARKLTNTDDSNYTFNLSEGEHTLTLVAVKDSMAIAGIEFCVPKKNKELCRI